MNDCGLSSDGGVVEGFVDVDWGTRLHFHLFVTQQGLSELEHPMAVHELLSRWTSEGIDSETFFEEVNAALAQLSRFGQWGMLGSDTDMEHDSPANFIRNDFWE